MPPDKLTTDDLDDAGATGCGARHRFAADFPDGLSLEDAREAMEWYRPRDVIFAALAWANEGELASFLHLTRTIRLRILDISADAKLAHLDDLARVSFVAMTSFGPKRNGAMSLLRDADRYKASPGSCLRALQSTVKLARALKMASPYPEFLTWASEAIENRAKGATGG